MSRASTRVIFVVARGTYPRLHPQRHLGPRPFAPPTFGKHSSSLRILDTVRGAVEPLPGFERAAMDTVGHLVDSQQVPPESQSSQNAQLGDVCARVDSPLSDATD